VNRVDESDSALSENTPSQKWDILVPPANTFANMADTFAKNGIFWCRPPIPSQTWLKPSQKWKRHGESAPLWLRPLFG